MPLFDDVPSETDYGQSESRQLPDNLVNDALGEVNIRRTGEILKVSLTIRMTPDNREGWQTGVALDASSSMRGLFGKMLDRDSVPADVIKQLQREGLVERSTSDGQRRIQFSSLAQNRLRELGVVLRRTPNVVQPIARKSISYLAKELDEDQGTTVVYWACGKMGDEYEVVGDFTAEQCVNLELTGPAKRSFGDGTRLTPVVRYFVDRFQDARQGLYVFVTDGRLDDMDDLTNYTTELARQIAAGRQNPVKCILIGVGSQIDVGQMHQFDDLDTGTAIDVWDHKIAREMRSMESLFTELVDEHRIVAPRGVIYSSTGAKVVEFNDGVCAKMRFTIPAAEEWFELDVSGQRIRQTLVFPNER